MNRLVSCMAALLLGVCAFAQNWVYAKTEADELKGIPSERYAYYQLLSGAGVLVWNDSDRFRLWTPDYTFFNWTIPVGGSGGTYDVGGLVGLYDLNNELIEKYTIFLTIQPDQVSVGTSWKYTRSQRAEAKAVADFLKDNIGYVRFIYPLYGGKELDLKVPCWSNPKE